MPRVRTRDLMLAALGGTVLVGLLALTASAGTGNEAVGAGSSFSNRADGARAAYLTLRELGYQVERSHDPLTAIVAEPASTVLVLASPGVGVSDQDKRALTAFLERGGVVLATGLGGALALGSEVKAQPLSDRERYTYHPPADVDLTAGAPAITMAPELRNPALVSYERVYGPAHEPVVMRARIGAGQAVWWGGSTPLTNEAVGEASNFELLLNVLGDGTRAILWDEHYHGHARSLWSYAAATPLPWLLAQSALLGLAAMLTWSRRPGPLRPRVVDPRTSPMEFVETMGGLYERAGAAAAAVETARRRLRRLLASSSGLALETPDEQLARAAAARTALDGDALSDLLGDSVRASGRDSAAALSVVQRLQAASAAVSAAPGRRWLARGGPGAGHAGRAHFSPR